MGFNSGFKGLRHTALNKLKVLSTQVVYPFKARWWSYAHQLWRGRSPFFPPILQ